MRLLHLAAAGVLVTAGCYLSHGPPDEPVPGEDAMVVGECFGSATTLTLARGDGCVETDIVGTEIVPDIPSTPRGTPLRLVREGLSRDDVSVTFRVLECPPGAPRFAVWQPSSSFSDCSNAMQWSTTCDLSVERTFTWQWIAADDPMAELLVEGEGIVWRVSLCEL